MPGCAATPSTTPLGQNGQTRQDSRRARESAAVTAGQTLDVPVAGCGPDNRPKLPSCLPRGHPVVPGPEREHPGKAVPQVLGLDDQVAPPHGLRLEAQNPHGDVPRHARPGEGPRGPCASDRAAMVKRFVRRHYLRRPILFKAVLTFFLRLLVPTSRRSLLREMSLYFPVLSTKEKVVSALFCIRN